MAKRFKLISCNVLFREVSLIAAQSENFIDATFLRQGLHDTPEILQKTLQAEIDRIDSGDDIYTFHARYNNWDFDAILLGYGLCSNGIVGIHSKKYPIVIPRAHDCITLFLGSKEKYADYFGKNSGTFWYNASWIENSPTPSEQTEKEMLEVYAEKYGDENAEFLVSTELTGNYSQCAFIRWDELPFPQYEKYTQDAAEYFGWEYDLVEGDSDLMRDFLNGNWSDERFLIIPPGKTAASDAATDDIIQAI